MARELYLGGLRNGAAQRVFIATPVTACPSPEYAYCLFQTHIALDAAGIECDLAIHVGDCHVDDARNELVRNFLESDCTDLLFIDADQGWSPVELVRLLQYDHDVVAGIPPYKTDIDQGFPLIAPAGDLVAVNGTMEVPKVGTGFLRIRRHVLEQMWEAEPRKHRGPFESSSRKPIAIIFERMFVDGNRLGGDYSFCHKWRQMGGSIHVDPDMTFCHVGDKVWIGNLSHYWCEHNGVLHPAFVSALEKLQAGDVSDETLAELHKRWNNNYSASAELCGALSLLAREHNVILETGSGLSTLVMAAAAPDAEIHSLESDRVFFERTERAIAQLGLTNIRLHYAPLRQYDGFLWYEIPADLPNRFGLVLCDGPPRRYGRSGLFRLLADRLRGAVLVVDDAETEGDAMREWAGREFVLLGEDRKFAVSAPKTMSEAA